jgi:hypothetical protein
MATNIKIFNSYIKGTKTIKGYFPIYTPDNEKDCNIEEEISYQKSNIQELLEENTGNALITQESDELNVILLLVNVNVNSSNVTYYIQI